MRLLCDTFLTGDTLLVPTRLNTGPCMTREFHTDSSYAADSEATTRIREPL